LEIILILKKIVEACGYISKDNKEILTNMSIEVGKLINNMILNPEKFGVKTVN